MHPTTLTVNLSDRSYPIYLGEHLLSDVSLLQKHITAKQVLLVTNVTVGSLYLNTLKQACHDKQVDEILLPDGEQFKNLTSLTKIFDLLIAKHHHRSTTLIALGGGVICDITGFAAACYQRGVAFIQIPTTLLAQVDASIGGKTAVNHPAGKNMIGAFYQPRCVIIDVNVLNTLPEREFFAGIAEIIKAALICDADFFCWLENHIEKLLQRDKTTLMTAINKACAIKAAIVTADEKEITGERVLLNLGHTFAHAIEHNSGYGTFLHGEAVAIGLMLATQLSQALQMLDSDAVKRVQHLLQRAHLPTQLPPHLTADALLSTMALDKKFDSGNKRFVLLQALGKAIVVNHVKLDLLQPLLNHTPDVKPL